MNVLVLSQYFWPETFGINSLVKSLRDRDARVVVLTGKPNYPDGVVFGGYRAAGTVKETYAGLEVLRVPIVPRGQRSAVRLALNYVSFVLSAAVFGRWLLRGRDLDLVFVYAPSPLLQAIPAVFIARSRGIPLVVWVQDLWPESLSATGYAKNPWLLAGVERIVRWIYKHTDMILVQSEAFRAPVNRLTDDARKVRYFPNSVLPLGEAGRISERGEELLSRMKTGLSVVFAGNLGQAQSLDTIVEAAEKLRDTPEVRIFLVGSGSADAMISAEVERRGLKNVVLSGRLPPEDMPAVFEAATALLVTLKAEPIFALTVPSKVQAYLAAGRPIIAAIDGEGARLIREAGAGFVCPAEDPEGLARAIRDLVALPETDRQIMGARGREFSEAHFNPDRLADDLMGHLAAAVARRSGAAT